MARKPPAKPRDTTVALPPCEICAGVECGSSRVPVCCPDCTH